MKELPLFKELSTDFFYTIEIEETLFTFRIFYNSRNDSWYLDISTDNYRLDNIKIVANYPLLDGYKALFPELEGDLFVYRVNTSTNEEITFDNFDIDYKFLYFTESEVTQYKGQYGF